MTVSFSGDPSFANVRLNHSIVLSSNNNLIEVQEVDGMDGTVYGTLFNGVRSTSLDGSLKLPDLNLEPPQLGWVNVPTRGCTYLTRMPSRQWRQGLRLDNIHTLNFSLGGSSLLGQPLYRTVNKIFPSLEECYELLQNNEAESWAFSNNFSLLKRFRDIAINFKQTTVGTVQERGSLVPTLLPNYSFLQEVFQDERH